MASEETTWKRCSTCKKPIPFVSNYHACSVSTCNRRGALFVFCSVACWDGHVPVMRHRDAWAVEATAPTAAEWARTREDEIAPASTAEQADARPTSTPQTGQADARVSRRVIAASPPAGGDRSAPPRAGAAGRGGAAPSDTLVVVSKLKHYIRATSGMNTSDEVVELLSRRLRDLCDHAVEQARAAGRKTVMARDFVRR